MPTKSTLITVAFTLLAIALIHRVEALEPIKDAIYD